MARCATRAKALEAMRGASVCPARGTVDGCLCGPGVAPARPPPDTIRRQHAREARLRPTRQEASATMGGTTAALQRAMAGTWCAVSVTAFAQESTEESKPHQVTVIGKPAATQPGALKADVV